jgi:hypothetical protein
MARPPRIEFAGAVYLVSAHAPQGALAFRDEQDCAALLELLARALQRFDAQALAYSLAPQGYQLLLHTRQANLSQLMRHLGGVYTQAFNRRHSRGGAVFQGRFRALLVDRERLLLDVCRYVDLAAQRAGLARDGRAWLWHSRGAHLAECEAPVWLDVDGLYGHLLGRAVHKAGDRRRAAERYGRLLAAEPQLDIWRHLRRQIFLGDEDFVASLGKRRPARGTARRLPRSLLTLPRSGPSRAEALYRAHTEAGLSMSALAAELGLSVSRISRIIAAHERQRHI